MTKECNELGEMERVNLSLHTSSALFTFLSSDSWGEARPFGPPVPGHDGRTMRGTRGVRRALSHLTPFGSFIRARRSLALPSSVPSAGNRAHLGSLATLATPSAPLREVRKERAKRGVERRT